MLVTGCLVASGVVVVGSLSAAAADAGTVVIGAQPVTVGQPVDPGLGVLTPTADAPEKGMFGPQVDWPVVPIHAALARTGDLITFGTPRGVADQSGLVFDQWSPAAGSSDSSHRETATMHSYDSFCNALVELDDGRLLMVEGNSAMSSMLYDPSDQSQAMGQDLKQQRWYATTLRLPDGRVLVLGGGNSYELPTPANSEEAARVAITPEIGSGTGEWTRMTGASSSALFGLSDSHWWYPRAFNGIGGTVLGISGDAVWRLDPSGAGSVEQIGTLPFDPRTSGSQVMFAPGRILIAGGGQYSNGDDIVGTSAAAIVDFDASGADVSTTSSMAAGRNWANLTVLPTGEVLANGGTRVGTEGGDGNSVRTAEIWTPSTGTWRNAASAARTRTYHSTSVLLPSGAVFTGGGGIPGPETNFNAEIYYPPYLFTRDAAGAAVWASRPAITSIAGSASYGGTIDLTTADARPVQGASLISLPAVTHSQNTDQRRVPLQISQDGAAVHAVLPASTDTMPPGDYELTVTDSAGVPSAAQIITIRRDGAGSVTPTTGDEPVAPASSASPADAASGTGAAGAPSDSPAAGPAPAASSAAPSAAVAVATAARTVRRNASVGISPSSKSRVRLAGSGHSVGFKRLPSRVSTSLRRATSWTVRAGIGRKSGYSFESVDQPGLYLAAPTDGTGRMTLVKRSKASSFPARVTFTAVQGALGHDYSFRLASSPTRVLRSSGSALVIGGLGKSPGALAAATFTLPKGFAPRR